jgi:hypothetical protein
MNTKLRALGLAIAIALGGRAAVAAGPATAPATTTSPTAAPLAGSPAGTPTTGPSVPPDVAALIQQLDADDWQARDAAAEQLVAKGDAVRPAMADAAAHSASPEVRSRAAGVIAKLNQLAAERPTTITLHLTDANPREVFAAIARQAGISIRIWPDHLWTGQFGVAPKVTMDLQDRPFWEALSEACRRSGSRPERMGFDEDLTIMEGRGTDPLAGPRCDAGRFTLVAQSFSRQRQINYADGQTNGGDMLSMVALLDPKLRLAHGSGVLVQLDAATDDKGNSLLPAQAATPQELMGSRGGPMLDLSVALGPVPATATRIASLRGQLSAAVVARSERMTIEDIARAGQVTRRVGSYTVELQKAEVGERNVSYTVLIRSTGMGMPSLAARDLRLEDADGQPLRGGGGSSTSGFNGQLKCDMQVRTAEPIHGPVRLVWDVVTQTKTVKVPFEFHDLKLPPA